MSNEDQTLWGIHAGRLGVADSLFLKKDVIAIGWDEMGDVTSIGGDREALKAKISETYPKAKPGAIPPRGQVFFLGVSGYDEDQRSVDTKRILLSERCQSDLPGPAEMTIA